MENSGQFRRFTTFIFGAVLAVATLTSCSSDREDIAEPEIGSSSIETSSEVETAASSSESSGPQATPTPVTKSNAKPDCSNKALRDSGFGKDTEAILCQDSFAKFGIPGTDSAGIASWDGAKWVEVPKEGVYQGGAMSGEPCYQRALLDEMGVPETLRVFVCEGKKNQSFDEAIAELPKADPDSPYITVVGLGEAGEQASYPACDGRNILILDSIIDNTSDTAFRLAQQVLTQHPSGVDTKYTVPGQCPSLRAQLDGNDIYPVYLDFGSDVNAMCAAKAQYGGNGRVLSNSAEYVDPC
mgnify:CR=1 FL=1